MRFWGEELLGLLACSEDFDASIDRELVEAGKVFVAGPDIIVLKMRNEIIVGRKNLFEYPKGDRVRGSGGQKIFICNRKDSRSIRDFVQEEGSDPPHWAVGLLPGVFIARPELEELVSLHKDYTPQAG